MRKIRIGVYDNNCGHQITAEFKKKHQINAEIVAACNCPDAADYGNVTEYSSLEEMLADDTVELVSLCSPNRRKQAEDAIKCMKSGKHVYAEKPCAMSIEDLEKILKTAEETGMQFHEMAGSVFVQPYYAMRELVQSGVLGEIVQVYTQKSYPLNLHRRPQNEDIDGGMIRQVGVHNLRFIEHTTGLKITDIDAMQTNIGNTEGGNLHTAASFMMRLENGAVASAVANYMNSPKGIGKYGNECVRIFGTCGYAEIMDAGRQSRVIVNGEYQGELDTQKSVKSFFEYYIDNLLGLCEMPLTLEEELHPTKMVIIAANKCGM